MTERDTRMATSSVPSDDRFELFDLKVEVVVPQNILSSTGEAPRLLCGANLGDYFTLKGEMLYLPPNQGISVYSLGEDLSILC